MQISKINIYKLYVMYNIYLLERNQWATIISNGFIWAQSTHIYVDYTTVVWMLRHGAFDTAKSIGRLKTFSLLRLCSYLAVFTAQLKYNSMKISQPILNLFANYSLASFFVYCYYFFFGINYLKITGWFNIKAGFAAAWQLNWMNQTNRTVRDVASELRL